MRSAFVVERPNSPMEKECTRKACTAIVTPPGGPCPFFDHGLGGVVGSFDGGGSGTGTPGLGSYFIGWSKGPKAQNGFHILVR